MEKKIDRVEDYIVVPGRTFGISTVYDKNNYKIELLDNIPDDTQELEEARYNESIDTSCTIKITRLSDNSVRRLHFDDYCDSIIQTYKDGVSHIVVIEEGTFSNLRLNNYIDNKDELELYYYLECKNIRKLTDTSYAIIDLDDTYVKGDRLYNLNEISDAHNHIFYYEENVKERIKENYIMVEDELVGKSNDEFVDTLTYGIDLDTFKIVTPIHSTFHRRDFDLDSTESLVEYLNDASKTVEKSKKLYMKGAYNKEFASTFKRNK